jgi:cytochrome c oxidase cbb3-type subunit 4
MQPDVIETAAAIDMGQIRGAITALTMAVYAGIFWWAYRGKNRERFEADALMPFADDEPAGPSHSKECER